MADEDPDPFSSSGLGSGPHSSSVAELFTLRRLGIRAETRVVIFGDFRELGEEKGLRVREI